MFYVIFSVSHIFTNVSRLVNPFFFKKRRFCWNRLLMGIGKICSTNWSESANRANRLNQIVANQIGLYDKLTKSWFGQFGLSDLSFLYAKYDQILQIYKYIFSRIGWILICVFVILAGFVQFVRFIRFVRFIHDL